MDTDLPASGDACDIVLTYDGAPVNAAVMVEVSITKNINTRRSKPLGTTTTHVATDFDGWTIKLVFDVSKPGILEFVDVLTSGEILKIPSLVGLTIRRAYRNFEKKGHTYLDLKVTAYNERVKRNENNKVEITLETGQNRIAV